MVHWGQSEIQAQLSRVETIKENGNYSSDAARVTPNVEHKFQAGRHSLNSLFDSMKTKDNESLASNETIAKLLNNAKTVADLWKEKAHAEKPEESKNNGLKEFQIKLTWYGIVNAAELDKNCCKMCQTKAQRYHKRSKSI